MLNASTLRGDRLPEYLAECRYLVIEEIRAILPKHPRYNPILYNLMLEYPLRDAKGLRPALCIATCRALGGSLEAALRSAAALELYHNAFLIHDDVEDGSDLRRNQPTLHREHGVAIAVNVGDAMLALALQPLLDNMALVGLGKALRVLQVVARMARETAEGQATELAWIRDGKWAVSDIEYLRMVHKKTGWYTFLAPVLIGAILAGVSDESSAALRKFAVPLGIAFQIQDDVLNLTADPALYGKDAGGDLWEGKHSLVLIHALRATDPAARDRARTALAKPRPANGRHETRINDVLADLERTGTVTPEAAQLIRSALDVQHPEAKTGAEISWLRSLIDVNDSIGYARRTGRRWVERAHRQLSRLDTLLPPSIHRTILDELVEFVMERRC